MNTATATAIATIANAKAHIVPTQITADDIVKQVASGWTFKNGRNVRKFTEVTIPAGTRVYGAPICGTTRNNGNITWDNHIVEADEVTCTKCLATAGE